MLMMRKKSDCFIFHFGHQWHARQWREWPGKVMAPIEHGIIVIGTVEMSLDEIENFRGLMKGDR